MCFHQFEHSEKKVVDAKSRCEKKKVNDEVDHFFKGAGTCKRMGNKRLTGECTSCKLTLEQLNKNRLY